MQFSQCDKFEPHPLVKKKNGRGYWSGRKRIHLNGQIATPPRRPLHVACSTKSGRFYFFGCTRKAAEWRLEIRLSRQRARDSFTALWQLWMGLLLHGRWVELALRSVVHVVTHAF